MSLSRTLPNLRGRYWLCLGWGCYGPHIPVRTDLTRQLPRITNAGQTWVSARAVKESYEKLLGPTLKDLPPAAQIGVMTNIDWLLHQQALDAIQFTKEFIARIKTTTHTRTEGDVKSCVN